MKVTVWSLCEVANMCTMHEKGRVMGRHELLIPSLGRIPLGDRGHVGHYAIIAGLLGTSISHITHFHTLTRPISNQFSPMYLRILLIRTCTPTLTPPLPLHTHQCLLYSTYIHSIYTAVQAFVYNSSTDALTFSCSLCACWQLSDQFKSSHFHSKSCQSCWYLQVIGSGSGHMLHT